MFHGNNRLFHTTKEFSQKSMYVVSGSDCRPISRHSCFVLLLVALVAWTELLYTANAAHIMMVSSSFRGHIVPLARLADELSLRGHQLSFAVQEEGRIYVNKSNSRIYPLSSSNGLARNELLTKISYDPGVFGGVLSLLNDVYLAQSVHIYESLSKLVERLHPTIMVIDIGILPAVDVAQLYNIPYIINNPSLIYHLDSTPLHVPAWRSSFDNIFERSFSVIYPRLLSMVLAPVFMGVNKLRNERQLPPYTSLSNCFDNCIILVNTAFGFEYPRKLDPWTHMTGPIMPIYKPNLSNSLAQWIDKNNSPIVVVLFGSGAMPYLENWQIKVLSHALSESGMRVIWSLKTYQKQVLGSNISSSYKVKSNFKQLPVLSHSLVRIVISPCGMATVQESLYYGKPLLCIPILGDQMDVASRVVDAQVGITLNKNMMDVNDVSHSLRALYKNTNYRYYARRLGKLLRETDGIQKSADIIERAIFPGFANSDMDINSNLWFSLLQSEQRLPWYKVQQLDIIVMLFSIFCVLIVIARCIGIFTCFLFYRCYNHCCMKEEYAENITTTM